MWDMILAGRYVMIPIGICSLVEVAIIVERVLVLRRNRIVLPEIVGAVESLAAATDTSAAYAICERRPGPFASIVRSGLDHADDDWQVMRDAMQETGRQEAKRLVKHLNLLELIAGLGPLLGLLGTVVGMIRTFADARLHGIGNPQELSGGISEAMIATVAGLAVGIPALIAHNLLSGRVDGIVLELEVHAYRVLDTLRTRRKARA
jgi:biopolymer transport protein ExbB